MTTFNRNIEVFASAARTASVNSADFANEERHGLHLIIDVTADPASASITVTIEGKDAVSGKYYDILVSPAIIAVGTTVLKVYPGIAVSANAAANDVLPPTWRVKVVVVDTDSLTYSVGANLVN